MNGWPSSARWTRADTALGEVVVSADHEGLRSIGFPEAHAPEPGGTRDDAALRWVVRSVHDWFDGDLTLETLPVHLEVTTFQRCVLDELRRIPPGEQRSYAQIADGIGRPAATRAVGGACGRNLQS